MGRLVAHKFIIPLLILVLTGCAKFNVSPDYELQEGKQVGLLVMSINHNTEAITLDYRKIDKSESGAIMTSTMHDEIDFKQPKGRLVVLELSPGSYEFYQWQTNFGRLRYVSPLISAPFTIEQGKAVYVGSLDVKAELENPMVGVEYGHTITDKSERDIALLKKKYPKLDVNRLDIQISSITQGIILR